MPCSRPGRLWGAGSEIRTPIHRRIPRKETAHGVRYDVELHARLSKPTLQSLNSADKKLCVFHVVAAPVIRENVKGILRVFSCRGGPISFAVAAAGLQRVDQPFID